MIGIAILLALALLFYLIIPGLGAFHIRSRWREFRKSVLDASLLKPLDYGISREQEGYCGLFRIIGRFQGLEDNDRVIWIKNDKLSVKVDISTADFYLLPSSDGLEFDGRLERHEALPGSGSLRKLKWKNLLSIDERSEFLVAGPLFSRGKIGFFQSSDTNRLLVLLFDGDARSIMRRAIWAGRQRNEYWNAFTGPSLLLGAFLLFITAYLSSMAFGNIDLASYALVFSLLPLVPLLPPGVLLFFLYRFLWERGRVLRAERDLFLLPTRFHLAAAADPGRPLCLPDGELYGKVQGKGQEWLLETPGAIRISRILSPAEEYYYAYGRIDPHNPDCILPVGDPLVENVILPGDPFKLSSMCRKGAYTLEILSGLVFLAGFFINMLLVFQLNNLLFR